MKKRRMRLLLLLVLLFALATRLWRVWIPTDYYFDEVYHAYTAAFYAANDPAGYEWWHTSPHGVAIEWLHPPVSKLLMGLSIVVLGDNSFAWRLPSVLFGALTVWATYWLAVEITKKKELGLLAAMLASFDGLLLTQSRIAMNDIFVTFFILMTLVFYWRYVKQEREGLVATKNMLLTGLAAGLAVSTKWSGVFVVGVIGVWEVLRFVIESEVRMQLWIKKILAWLILPVIVYLLSFSQWWLQGHTWGQFKELHNQIWWYQTNLDATHPWQSKPWQWVLDIKPVWFWVNYHDSMEGNIYAFANPVISWLGLGGMIYLAYKLWKKKEWDYGILILAYLMVWLPWSISPRIMFYYHYAPAIPLLCIALAVWLADGYKNNKKRWIVRVWLVVISGAFLVLYPYWTGIEVPKKWVGVYKMVYEWPRLIGWKTP